MYIDLIKQSLRNTRRRLSRTLLTMLGISVGVASVAVISAIGSFGTASVNRELDLLGMSGITVTSADLLQPLAKDDLESIISLNGVEGAMPIMSKSCIAQSRNASKQAVAWGILQGEQQVISMKILHGRALSLADIQSSELCCLVDEKLAKALFGVENVVGKRISIPVGSMTGSFEIVGVTATESGILQTVMGDMVPEFVYIPYTTMSMMSGSESLEGIAVTVSGKSTVEGVSESIKKQLSDGRGKDSIKVENLSAQRDKLNELLSLITLVLSAIGAISLLVSGLGIMTVMLVSVSERTREIGVKKAIGADERSIMFEFFVEALTISVFGSIIGAVVGIVLCTLIGAVVGSVVMPDVGTLLFGMMSAVVTGGLFGLFPAIKASRLRPIEALRCE